MYSNHFTMHGHWTICINKHKMFIKETVNSQSKLLWTNNFTKVINNIVQNLMKDDSELTLQWTNWRIVSQRLHITQFFLLKKNLSRYLQLWLVEGKDERRLKIFEIISFFLLSRNWRPKVTQYSHGTVVVRYVRSSMSAFVSTNPIYIRACSTGLQSSTSIFNLISFVIFVEWSYGCMHWLL